MSEQRQLLADSAARLFEANGGWDEIEALGIVDILVPEERGGSGADWDDACAVLQAAGRWQIPLPLAEAMIARKLLAAAALEVPRSRLSIAPNPVGTLSRDGRGWRFSGTLASVPWGRDVDRVVTTMPFDGRPHVVVLAVADAGMDKRTNLADEPRDDLKFDGAAALAAPADCREAQEPLRARSPRTYSADRRRAAVRSRPLDRVFAGAQAVRPTDRPVPGSAAATCATRRRDGGRDVRKPFRRDRC